MEVLAAAKNGGTPVQLGILLLLGGLGVIIGFALPTAGKTASPLARVMGIVAGLMAALMGAGLIANVIIPGS